MVLPHYPALMYHDRSVVDEIELNKTNCQFQIQYPYSLFNEISRTFYCYHIKFHKKNA